MTVYYNEFDLTTAQWLENLIKAGHIAAGVVDRRSILDVRPNDLRGFAQCHFFAGIGVWSYALRAAGWPDDRSVWTGSCPCQPFSTAGDGAGFADERHLWPAFSHLIKERKPERILGEQVASKDVDPWIDLVHADLEAMGYAFGGVPFPAASVGAPHIRDRLYWVADAAGVRRSESGLHPRSSDAARRSRQDGVIGDARQILRVADTNGRDASTERQQRSGEQRQQPQDGCAVRLADATISGRREECADAGGITGGNCAEGNATGSLHGRSLGRLAYTNRGEFDGVAIVRRPERNGQDTGRPQGGCEPEPCGAICAERPGPTNGFWRDADWLGCRDGKWRPVEPGTFPLAHGVAGRVGSLRGYGNAINAEQARIFIECVMECRP